MGLGILFCLIALATPLWSITVHGDVGEWDTGSYGWLGVTTDRYVRSAYDGSAYQPYSGPTFDQHVLASAVGTSYVLILVFLIVLVFVVALFSTGFAHTMPRLGLLIVAVLVLIFAFTALFYPILTVPNAAATDFRMGVLSSGFWGSASLPEVVTWGAGLGWWLLLLGVILGGVGGALPFLQGMRQPLPPPPPRQWQVEP